MEQKIKTRYYKVNRFLAKREGHKHYYWFEPTNEWVRMPSMDGRWFSILYFIFAKHLTCKQALEMSGLI